jgi:hypothetical protein
MFLNEKEKSKLPVPGIPISEKHLTYGLSSSLSG